jgi:hypothetical protein
MGIAHTPETGYPILDMLMTYPFEDDDLYKFVRNGEELEMTAKQLNELIRDYRTSEAGQIAEERRLGLRPPLFTIVGNSSRFEEGTKVFLGDSDDHFEVTNLEPGMVTVFNEINGRPE